MEKNQGEGTLDTPCITNNISVIWGVIHHHSLVRRPVHCGFVASAGIYGQDVDRFAQ